MDLPVIPVVNGVLPHPDSGTVKGVFLDPSTARLLQKIAGRSPVLLLPYLADQTRLYPVGVAVRTAQMWVENVYIGDRNNRVSALFAKVQGFGRFRVNGFAVESGVLVAQRAAEVSLEELRPSHPCVDGAGWQVMQGQTDMKSYDDLTVTLYGVEYERGRPVSLQANLGGLLTFERAHTIEHAMIRALSRYGLCTTRTLATAIGEESAELRASLELGYRLKTPEVFGVTASGACGNPLTDLAHFYLSQEVIKEVEEGNSLLESLHHARQRVLSHITEDLELTTNAGWRVMQGLKKGMLHDDTRLDQTGLAQVLNRFPISPWH